MVFSLQYLIILINLRYMTQNLGIYTYSEVLYVNQQNLFPVYKNQGCFEWKQIPNTWYSKTCLIQQVLGENVCVGINRVSDYTV